MEHMGGLVPLLIGRIFYSLESIFWKKFIFDYFSGRQVNRFLPQFYISLFPTSSSEIPEINGSSAQVGE